MTDDKINSFEIERLRHVEFLYDNLKSVLQSARVPRGYTLWHLASYAQVKMKSYEEGCNIPSHLVVEKQTLQQPPSETQQVPASPQGREELRNEVAEVVRVNSCVKSAEKRGREDDDEEVKRRSEKTSSAEGLATSLLEVPLRVEVKNATAQWKQQHSGSVYQDAINTFALGHSSQTAIPGAIRGHEEDWGHRLSSSQGLLQAEAQKIGHYEDELQSLRMDTLTDLVVAKKFLDHIHNTSEASQTQSEIIAEYEKCKKVAAQAKRKIICKSCGVRDVDRALKLCGHVFCSECIEVLMRERKRHCPMCNQKGIYSLDDTIALFLS